MKKLAEIQLLRADQAYQFDKPTIDAKNICQENGYFVYCGKSDPSRINLVMYMISPIFS